MSDWLQKKRNQWLKAFTFWEKKMRKQKKGFNKKLRRLAYWGRPIADPTAGNDQAARVLQAGHPAAIGKIGGLELDAIVHYDRYKNARSALNWERRGRRLFKGAGVFPRQDEVFNRFSSTVFRYTRCYRRIGGVVQRGRGRYRP